MQSATNAGRVIGILILLQMAGSATVNFGLEAPLFGSPGFLLGAESHALQIGLAAILGIMTEGLSAAIAIIAFPILKERVPSLALSLIVFSGVVLAFALVENANVMSMVSLSSAYAKASLADRQQLEALRIVVAAARNWPHFLARMLDGATLFVLYAALFRGSLAPRVIAGFGLLTTTLQIVGVAMPLFGHAVIFPLLAPLGLSQLLLAIWLIVRGLPVSDGELPVEQRTRSTS